MRNISWHIALKACALLIGQTMFLLLETGGQTRKHCFLNKNASEFVEKHFCLLESKFVSALDSTTAFTQLLKSLYLFLARRI